MPTKINLASKPFSNRSLPWTITAVVIFFSMISLVFIVRATSTARSKAYAVQNDINRLRQEEQVLRQRAEAVRKSLTLEQQQTLASAHQLVDRKRFSWSRLFSDLETALPPNVRVKRIAVSGVVTRAEETLAELELIVVAKDPGTVTDMIADMDRNGIFHAEISTQNLQRGRGEAGTEYELFVVYRPRVGVPGNAVASVSNAPSVNEVSKGNTR
jgi:Tfp pilus assembly protein PilN